MDSGLTGWFDPATITPWDLAFAAVTFLAAWIASNVAKKGVLAVLGRLRGFSAGGRLLTARLVKYAIILIGVGVGLSFLGASVQPLLAMALVVGVVVVLALRGISANFAAGVLLQTRQPVRVGEQIESDGLVGTIQELNARSVVIISKDGRTVHVPNAHLLEMSLVNDSRLGRRRSEIEVRVEGGRTEVVEILAETVVAATTSARGVLSAPSVQLLVVLMANDRRTLRVLFWHEPETRAETVSDVVQALAGALRQDFPVFTVTSVLPVAPLTAPPTV